MRRLVLAGLLALGGCAAITGNTAQDTAAIQQRIVAACLASPLFKAADGALSAAVPAAALPVDLVNAGVDIVCADPAKFAALDATTADWVLKNLAPYIPQKAS